MSAWCVCLPLAQQSRCVLCVSAIIIITTTSTHSCAISGAHKVNVWLYRQPDWDARAGEKIDNSNANRPSDCSPQAARSLSCWALLGGTSFSSSLSLSLNLKRRPGGWGGRGRKGEGERADNNRAVIKQGKRDGREREEMDVDMCCKSSKEQCTLHRTITQTDDTEDFEQIGHCSRTHTHRERGHGHCAGGGRHQPPTPPTWPRLCPPPQPSWQYSRRILGKLVPSLSGLRVHVHGPWSPQPSTHTHTHRANNFDRKPGPRMQTHRPRMLWRCPRQSTRLFGGCIPNKTKK